MKSHDFTLWFDILSFHMKHCCIFCNLNKRHNSVKTFKYSETCGCKLCDWPYCLLLKEPEGKLYLKLDWSGYLNKFRLSCIIFVNFGHFPPKTCKSKTSRKLKLLNTFPLSFFTTLQGFSPKTINQFLSLLPHDTNNTQKSETCRTCLNSIYLHIHLLGFIYSKFSFPPDRIYSLI